MVDIDLSSLALPPKAFEKNSRRIREEYEWVPDADFSAWTPPAHIAGVIRWLASDAGATVRGGLIPV